MNSKKITFGDFSQEWLEFYKKDSGIRTSTFVESYERTVSRYLIPVFGATAIEDITPLDIRKFVKKISKTYSKSTVSKNVICLNQIFRAAIENRLCDRNPAANIQIRSNIEPSKRKTYSDKEVKEIIEFTNKHVYSQEKISFICEELAKINVPYVDGSNCVYIPDYALKTCSSIAARFTPQKNLGVRAEIALDIDRLIYSSENLADLLGKLKGLGYEIKEGKYLAVKSPKAQRFVRLKSLGDEYLPKKIEKRIAEKEKFPNAVSAKSRSAGEIEQSFYATITQTIIEIRTMRYKPSKTNPKKIYSLDNDKDINFLSEQLLTMHDLNLNSRDRIYEAAEECTKSISEKTEKTRQLTEEIPTLKSDISQIKLLFSDLTKSKDTMAQMKISAAREKADKYGVKSAEDIENLERRLKLIPMYVQNLKSEISDEQIRLARVRDLIGAYENIIEGNYIDNLIAAQKEREQQEQIKDNKKL